MSNNPTCFSYFCQTCQEEHLQPLPEGSTSETELPTSCGNEYPEYPSAVIAIEESRYMEAAEAVTGVRKAFFDGETILVPETETATIRMLVERFGASVVYGQAKEYEFVTKARKAGVSTKLLKLGHSLGASIGKDADEMVRAASEQPSATLLAWSALSRSSMLPN